MFGSIVVGTDGSPTAGAAVAQAAELAEKSGARVHLVSAYKPLTGARVVAGAAAPGLDWSLYPDAKVDAILEDAAGAFRLRGVEVELHARTGDPADALIDVAERAGARLIVVGNRGMSGTGRFLLGSVPNKVSHHAPCSVMIVQTG